MSKIAIIIPSYEPDERLVHLIDDLVNSNIGPIYIVNDGSSESFDSIFEEITGAIHNSGGTILKHDVNKGKGRALKTAFEYILQNTNDVQAVVTADSDGQHTCKCIKKVIEASQSNHQSLILGVRTFDQEDIPWKSRFGNHLTEKIFQYITGVHISDTQTGLRAIPREYLAEFLDIKGERFEYEMRMLIEAVDKMDVVEVPIQTIYDSKENHQTHFNPLKDSLRIYRILCERFFKYLFSSVTSCILDILIFGVLCIIFKQSEPLLYITYSTIIARIISAIYNYTLNYKFVFKSNEKNIKAAIKYFSLAFIQMCCSAILVTSLTWLWPNGIEVVFKIIVDTLLFFISYAIQQRFVFKKK